MAKLLKEQSTITTKGQTTIPKRVRQALGVDYGGRIAFIIDDQQRVYIEKAGDETSDPIVAHFLEFLAQDMSKNPGTSVATLPATLRDRVMALVGDMEIDPHAAIEGDVAL